MFLAIEGIDGAGKATAARRLAAVFARAGRPVTELAFPRYEVPPYGPLLRDALQDSSGGPAAANARALLFALDRHAATPQIVSASADGVVVVDRWVWSNAAYLDAQLGSAAAEWIVDVEINRLGLPVPDATVLVTGAVDNARDRVRRRASRSDRVVDVLEQAATIQEGAAAAYERFATQHNWIVVRNTSTVGAFHAAIDKVASELLEQV